MARMLIVDDSIISNNKTLPDFNIVEDCIRWCYLRAIAPRLIVRTTAQVTSTCGVAAEKSLVDERSIRSNDPEVGFFEELLNRSYLSYLLVKAMNIHGSDLLFFNLPRPSLLLGAARWFQETGNEFRRLYINFDSSPFDNIEADRAYLIALNQISFISGWEAISIVGDGPPSDSLVHQRVTTSQLRIETFAQSEFMKLGSPLSC